MAATNQLAAIFVSGLSILFLFHVERIGNSKLILDTLPPPTGTPSSLEGEFYLIIHLFFIGNYLIPPLS